MVIPIPGGLIPRQIGGPTPYCLSLKPCFVAVLVLQFVLSVIRMVKWLHIMPGFIMLVGVGLGGYAVRENMDIQFICYFAAFCLIQGVLESVTLIDMAVMEVRMRSFSNSTA